jgi:3-oxoacyl-[acyl-carrier-protein] synthase-3
MQAGIVGLGLWVPDRIRRNDEWPESFVSAFHEKRDERRREDFTDVARNSTPRPHDDLFRRHSAPYEDDPFKGATERRFAGPEEPTARGDAAAASRALEDAVVAPRDIDLIMSSALVPDQLVPSNGSFVQEQLGCVNAAAIGVESYCSAALSQLDLAAALVACGRARFVLCVQSHQIGRVNDLELPTSPIFGDASTAFVVGQVPEGRGLSTMVRGGDGSLRNAVTLAYRRNPAARWWCDAEGPVSPGSNDWIASRALTDNVLAYGIDTIRDVCGKAELPLDAVAAFATVQPLVWYQAALADGLGVSAARIPSTYGRYAHVGGAGVIANLIEARQLGMLTDRAPVVLFAMGAGLTRFAAVLRWHER